MINFKLNTLSWGVIIALSLSACGGSSSSSSSSPAQDDPENPSEQSSAVISGQVIDGYLNKARVCADVNENFKCDENEPWGLTDATGSYSFDVFDNSDVLKDTRYECLIDSSCGDKVPALRVLVETTEETTNITLGTEKPLNEMFTLTSRAFLNSGKCEDGAGSCYKAPDVPVNPFTTLGDASAGNLDATKETFNTSTDDVAKSLGVDPEIIKTDYNNAKKVTPESKHALIAASVLVSSGKMPTGKDSLSKMHESELDVDSYVTDIKEYVENISKNTEETTDVGDIANAINTFDNDMFSSLSMVVGHEADEFKCGINKKGNVLCWGNNSQGNLGDLAVFPKDADGNPVSDGSAIVDNFSARPIVVKVSENTPLNNVKALDAGNGHVCAVTNDGSVYCWGNNWYGQAGVRNIDEVHNVYYAQKVEKGQQNTDSDYLSNVASVTLAHNSSCALTEDGQVYCWGDNSSKQLGDSYPKDEIKIAEGKKDLGGTIDISDLVVVVPYPVKVEFPDTVARVKQIIGGIWNYCALVENVDPEDHFNVYCWGDDTRGIVTQNWKQYQPEFMEKYASVLRLEDQTALADPDGTAPWYWRYWEEGRDYHSLFGSKVTQVRTLTNTEWEWENKVLKLDDASIEDVIEREDELDIWSNENSSVKEFVSKWCPQDTDENHRRCYITGWNLDATNCNTEEKWSDESGGFELEEKCSPVKVSGDWYQLRDFIWDNVGQLKDQHLSVTIHTPVTKEDPFDLNNVTQLRFVAGNFYIEKDNDSVVYGTYNNGTPNHTSRWTEFSSDMVNGEKIVKLDGCVEGSSPLAVITDKGHLYIIIGDGAYGISSSKVDGRILPQTFADGSIMNNVVDVSVGKRSICATVQKVSENDTEDTSTNELYCWGSSTFGQLGFDNGDNGFSYRDTALEWTGHTADNVYFDKNTRKVWVPKLVDFSSK